MDNNFAIKVENLSKRYRIGLKEKMHDSFGGALASWIKSPFVNWRQLRKLSNFNEKDEKDVIWALKNITFEVKQGQVIGIIGSNGAGKSTLLKIISRITEPSSGEVICNGRISSLLEVGTGFHSELTGRENIYLNGTILGMKKNEIDRKFDEIVAFSGIEKFIDTPVKRYSSGMTVRLAFSVAAHLEPEILLIDEVLAVGDAAFQKKCLSKMDTVSKSGRTVLFVSHNMGAIHSLCDQVILLKDGLIYENSSPQVAITKYYDSFSENFIFNQKGELIISKAVLKNSCGQQTNNFNPGEDLIVEIYYLAKKEIKNPNFWVGVQGAYGTLLSAIMLIDGNSPKCIQGVGKILCVFKSIPLLPQQYFIRIGVRDHTGEKIIVPSIDVGQFNVTGTLKNYGLIGEQAESYAWNTTGILSPYEWHLPDGQVIPISLKQRKTDV